jgi:hypothetical protein
MDDDGSIDDVYSASELREMDRDLEFRLDAEDDARNADAVEDELEDANPDVMYDYGPREWER